MTRPTLKPATLILTLLLPIGPGHAIAAADAAIPVSPGDWQTGAQLGDTCPSFSWGAVDGAQRYELAIFDAQWQDSPAYDDQLSSGAQLRQIEIAAPALSWTAAGADCLEAGGTYLWFVRAQTADGDGPWSAPRYFAIDYEADALTQTVRRELAAQLRQPQVWRDVIQAALASNADPRLTPLAPGVVTPAGAADGTGWAGAGSGRWEASAEQRATVLATSFPNPAALKINSPNGVVFNQSASGGGIPAEGDGTRFMWYPGKGALRAGGVSGTKWDDANIGEYSVALGYDTTASGYRSVALGYSTTASGSTSTALGYFTVASGNFATALGVSTEASGSTAMALGDNTIASSNASTAMGTGTLASGGAATAMGGYTIASGIVSTAMGFLTTAKSAYEMVIGSNNTDYTPASQLDWIATDRLFVIGNGASSSARSDALVVLKNGYVGIGTSKPGYRLQLATDSAAKPGTTTWTVASDARLKDLVGDYRSGLDEIAALQPVRYHYAIGNARGHDPEPEYVGFIAQQARAVFPEAVSEGADGYLDFNMHAVNVAMVNAIQTLREQNLALEAQLQAQAAQLQAQDAQMAEHRADKAALEQRLVSLEAEQGRGADLHAAMARLQVQMQVLQGQVMRATGNGQVALGR